MEKRCLLVVLYLAVGFIAGALFTRTMQPTEPEHVHDHRGGDTVQVSENMADPELSLSVVQESEGGYNLQIMTKNFTFAPQNASKDHIDGQGHAHIYVNDEKVMRSYGEWAHIELPSGEHTIEVTLNSNDHREYADQFGVPIVATETVVVSSVEKTNEQHQMEM